MKSRSSIAQAGRSALLAEARFLSATRPRMLRRATTGRRFGSNLTKKTPQGWFAANGRRRLISCIFAALALSIPSSSALYSKVNSSKSSLTMGQSISSRRNAINWSNRLMEASLVL